MLCNSSTEIEMHHVRTVKDVRTKIINRNATFEQWTGAVKRKQIPLCRYHHTLYHQGKLLSYEMKEISNYTANISRFIAKEEGQLKG